MYYAQANADKNAATMQSADTLKLLQFTTIHCNTCVYSGKADKKAAVKPIAKKPLRDHNTKQTATYCSTLQRTATHCNSLQHTAAHCNPLQHTCVHRKGRQESGGGTSCWKAFTRSQYKTTLQHTALSLQHTAPHCNSLRHMCVHRKDRQESGSRTSC